MVASFNTVQNVLRILREHLPEKKLLEILRELQTVEGNQSFKETIHLLYTTAKEKK